MLRLSLRWSQHQIQCSVSVGCSDAVDSNFWQSTHNFGWPNRMNACMHMGEVIRVYLRNWYWTFLVENLGRWSFALST